MTASRRPSRGGPKPARKRSLTAEQRAAISYRNPEVLMQYLSSRGRIRGRKQTGLSRRDQSRLAREVKRARELALLPYVISDDSQDRRPRRSQP